MPCGFSGDTGTRVTTNRTQWPPSGSTTRTCPSRSRSTSRIGSRGSVTTYGYHTEATQAREAFGGPGEGAPSLGVLILLTFLLQATARGVRAVLENPKSIQIDAPEQW